MATSATSPGAPLTVAELLEQLGGIAPERIRLRPPPGSATETDVVAIEAQENRLCELIDGVLVEKATGFKESQLAVALIRYLHDFVTQHQSGVVTAPDGMIRLAPGRVRIPDVAFIAWLRFPTGGIPEDPIPDLAPDLAVEILSAGNTPREMARKRREYFQAGVHVVWMINAGDRSVEIFTAVEESARLSETDTLDGGAVLPGFSLPLSQLFAELDRRSPGG